MEESIKECGKTGNSMEKACSLMLRAIFGKKASGMKEKEFVGYKEISRILLLIF